MMNLKRMFLVLMLTFAHSAMASSVCPSDAIKLFEGKWQGHQVPLPPSAAQQQSATQAEYVIVDCQTFRATFNYLNDDGNIVRTISFTGVPVPEHAGTFAIINGATTDASGSNELKGTFKQIQPGTLLGTFLGSLGGKPVYMTELMNATDAQNGVRQLVRTVQMFAGGKGGSYIASRVDSEQSVQ